MGFKLAEGKGLRDGWVPVKTTGMQRAHPAHTSGTQKARIRKNCGNPWKRQRPKEVKSPDKVRIFDRQLKVESKDARLLPWPLCPQAVANRGGWICLSLEKLSGR